MSRPKTTARMRRTEAQARFSDVVDDALHLTKTKQAEVARALGFSTPTKVQQWIDDELAQLPTLADVACMPREFACELLRQLAASHGLVVAEAPRVEEDQSSHIRRLADHQREASEANIAYLDAVADGVISKAEARKVRKEHIDLIEKSSGVVAAMDAVLSKESA